MAAKQETSKPKKTKTVKGTGRKARRTQYKTTERWRTNKQRRKESLALHLLKAKARRYRNHPEHATEVDYKAYHKLHP